jgi:hypothetical protein
VTHHVSLCLPKAAYMTHVSDNTIRYAGNTESIGKEWQVIEAEVQLAPESPKDDESRADVNASDKTPSKKDAPKKDKKLNARADLTIYKAYFSAAGGIKFTVVYILGLASIQIWVAVTKWLLGRINSSRPSQIVDDSEKTLPFVASQGGGMSQYLYPYLWSILLAVILQLAFNLHASSGSHRASLFLFHEMTFRVIRMPLLWLDTTPFGTMLKGFTVDTRLVDDQTLSTVSEFAQHLVTLMTIVGVG